MSKSQNDKKPPVDSAAAHIVTTFYPFTQNTQCEVVLVRGYGPRAERLRVWSGYLPVSRSDIAGMGAAIAARLLSDALARHLPAPDGEPLALGSDTAARERSGVPLGTVGGTVTTVPGQLTLNGL